MSKTETPKTETPTSKPADKPDFKTNPFATFDPMAYWAASQQMMREAIDEAHKTAASIADRYAALDPSLYWTSFRDAMTVAGTRASAAAEQYAALETQLVERAQAAVHTWAQLAHDAISYGAQLSAEARKLGTEAARKMGASA